jgi:HD-GYP domain-containing protein (c-di-GMP phosphodiesterase class II)
LDIANGKQPDRAKKLVTAINIAVANCLLYSRDHALIEESSGKTFSLLSEFLPEPVEMMVIDDDLVVNKLPLRDAAGTQAGTLLKRFSRKGLSRVDFLEGITPGEFSHFISDLAHPDSSVNAYPHIKTGLVDVSVRPAKAEEAITVENLPHFREEQIERLKAVYQNLTPFKQLNMSDLEDMIARFIATIGREISILKLLSPVKSYSNYTYVHSINVSILSIFQAEALGITGKLLHDIGLAALLHDVGKLFIPQDILEKKGALDENEFAAMSRHPALGTAYLARISGMARIVPIVAFEHHRKYDGTGYPKLKMGEKEQHPGSQLVAIADVFDALRSWRPYRKSLDMDAVLAIIKKGAGTDFNPFLVDNFISAFMKATRKQA